MESQFTRDEGKVSEWVVDDIDGRDGFTDRNHALAIVVQVFEHHLTESIDLARPRWRCICGQKLALFLQATHQPGQFADHARITADVDGLIGRLVFFGGRRVFQHQAEVEYELIAVVFVVRDADGVAEDAVSGDTNREKAVAELLTRDYIG